MLDIISQGESQVTLMLSTMLFEGFEELSLLRLEKEVGGGIYFLKNYNGKEINLEMWLCDVTKFVFKGFMPQKIYFKKI